MIAMVQVPRLARLVPPAAQPMVRRGYLRWRHRGLRSQDVVLVSYPKSGMTWLRLMLGYVLAERDVDFDTVRDLLPPLGRHRAAPALLSGGGRVARTHEPMRVIAPGPSERVVYVVRDGRDVAVSYFHHTRGDGRFRGSPDEFVPLFVHGGLDHYGPWHEHSLAPLHGDPHDRPSVMIVRYEDLRADTVAELGRLVAFLGETVEGDRIERAVAANTKPAMQAKEGRSAFMQAQRPDGSFVRTDGQPTWRELFGDGAREELQQALAPTLLAHGYALTSIDTERG